MELGATVVGAFTDRVTHLVAADHGSAKYSVRVVGFLSRHGTYIHWTIYQCALERKMPILQPSWISDSYQTWLRGDDVDLAEVISCNPHSRDSRSHACRA
jgi:DNA replication regulator DPB11